MRRSLAAVLAIVFAAAAVVLFLVGVLHAPHLGAHGPIAYHALQGTVTLTVVASLCSCVAIIATMVAVGVRR